MVNQEYDFTYTCARYRKINTRLIQGTSNPPNSLRNERGGVICEGVAGKRGEGNQGGAEGGAGKYCSVHPPPLSCRIQ